MNNASRDEKAIFTAARELTEAAQRRAFLDQACASDPSMRRRLEEMLTSQTQAEQFFAEGEMGLGLHGTVAVPLSEKPGDRIGRYKLLEKIGEGDAGWSMLPSSKNPCDVE
jgi:hypothetical protein